MAYRNFKMEDLKANFGIQEMGIEMFDQKQISLINPSDKLKLDLSEAEFIALSTEKAVSERKIAPVLVELAKLNTDFIQVFSGEKINTSNGLTGQIDFIIDKLPITLLPRKPFMIIVQSKIGLVFQGFDKAIAQALGIRYFNQEKDSSFNSIIYTVVTDGTEWRVGKLENDKFYIDLGHFSTENLPILLGILQHLVNFYKK